METKQATAAELVEEFHDLEDDLRIVREKLDELGIDPYSYIPGDEEETD